MSSAGADCVITLVEMRSAPGVGVGAHGVERDPARHLDEEPRGRGRRAPATTQARTASGVMLSSSTIVAPAAIASCTWLGAVALDLDRAARPRARARVHRVGDAQPGEVVVLHQHEVRQRAAVVHAAAGAHRGLLHRPQPGQGLAGVPDRGRSARRRRRTGG